MLSGVFYYIYVAFWTLAYRFGGIADWFGNQGWPLYHLEAPFARLQDILDAISNFFYDAYQAAAIVETVLAETRSKAKQVFDYVFEVLSFRVNDALNAAGDALSRATTAYNLVTDVWTYATGYLKNLANEAWDRAGNVWGSVTDWLKDKAIEAYNKAVWAYEQIEAAVTAKAQEIYAWVKEVPAEIKAFVDGVVADIGAVTVDIVQTLINKALAAIAAPINLINLRFDDIQDFFNSPLDWLESKFADWFLGKEQ